MEKKEVRVDCPCCQEVLTIDVRTEKVVRHHPREEGSSLRRDPDDTGAWDGAVGRVEARRASSGFEEALDKERSRERDLDDLFKKAKDQVDRRTDRDLL